MMNLDNIERPVGGQLLNSTTANPGQIRIAGNALQPDLFATGNNLQFLGDMVPRVDAPN